MRLLPGAHVNSENDLSCSWVLLVDGLVYFTGQLAILMTLNDF